MITLTKIKVINWHGFFNETIPVKGNILLSGTNGAGKSTLLDSVYFLLSGGDDKFNMAANDKANRTVESYIRGATGVEGRPYLRMETPLQTHIALEYFDEENEKHFILGVYLYLSDSANNNISKYFYHIPNHQIEEGMFTHKEGELQYINTYQDLAKFVDNEITLLNEESNKKEFVRNKISQIIGVNNSKYFELLPKGIVFKPINDINAFTYNFLMPERNVDTEKLSESIRVYRDISKKLSLEEEKQGELKKIVNKGKDYQKLDTRMSVLNAYGYYRSNQLDDGGIKNLEDEIIVKRNKVNELKNDIEAYTSGIDLLTAQIQAILSGEGQSGINEIDNRLKATNRQKAQLEEKIKYFQNDIASASRIAYTLGLKYRFEKYVDAKDFDGLQLKIKDFEDDYLESIRSLNSDLSFLTQNRNNLLAEKEQLELTKKSALSGLRKYDEKVLNLIAVIKGGIKAATGQDVDVTPFCELIDILPEENMWRDAIEGYLNNRRTDLFVSEKYFDVAVSLYERYKKEKNIYGVGLVNVAAIKDLQPLEGSLATKVTSSHKGALKYANFLLGDVIAVEDESLLKEYDASITPTVLVYRNHAVRQTNPRVYAIPMIGTTSIELQLSVISNEINTKIAEIAPLNEQIREISTQLAQVKNNPYTSIARSDNYWKEYDEVINRINTLEIQKGILRKQLADEGLLRDTSTLDEQLEALKGKRRVAESDKYDLELEIKATEHNIEIKRQHIEQNQALLEDYYQKDDVKKALAEFSKENKLSVSEIEKEKNNLAKEMFKLSGDITALMMEFNKNYHFDSVPHVDSLNEYENSLNTIIKNNLVVYRDDAEKSRQLVEIQFKESFISELRDNIRREKDNIAKLNRALSSKPFGMDKEIYRFEITPSKDKEFAQYYEIFDSDEEFSTTDLFSSQLTPEHSELLDELLLQLTSEKSDRNQEELLKRYTDYRSFMNYDVICTNKRGEMMRLSEIARSKSGGETQTPFYVMMAASFDQLLHTGNKTKNASCIVMLDEAFNNMDESRIKSMMELYQSLDLQFIVTVPSERLTYIFPYIDTTLLIGKQDGVMKAREIAKEE